MPIHLIRWRDRLRAVACASVAVIAVGCTGGSGSGDGSTDGAVDAMYPTAAHPAWPQVPSNTQEILQHVELVSIVARNDVMATDLFAMGDAVMASSWWPAVSAEYGVGPISTNQHITGPAITANPTTQQIYQYISNVVQGATDLHPNGAHIYMLFLPSGIEEIDSATGQRNSGCILHAGFHSIYDFTTGYVDQFAVIQRCPLAPGQSRLQSLSETVAHEILEGATDPGIGTGYVYPLPGTMPWTDDVFAVYGGPGQSELADLCKGSLINDGMYQWPRIWSNMAAAAGGDPCVPAVPGPYFNASAAMGWYAAPAGSAVTIPVTGWSTGAMPDWAVDAQLRYQSGGMSFQSALSGTNMVMWNGALHPTVNNGGMLTLTVTPQAGTASGTWGVYWIASGVPNGTGDAFHVWPVGVYVP